MIFEVVNLPLSDVEILNAMHIIKKIQQSMYDSVDEEKIYFEAFLMYYTLMDHSKIEQDTSFSRRMLRNKYALKQQWRGAQTFAKELEERAKEKVKERMIEVRRKLSHLTSNMMQESSKTRERFLSSIRNQYEARKKSLNKARDEAVARIEAEIEVIRKETREELDDEDEEVSDAMKDLLVEKRVLEARFDMEDNAFFDAKTQGAV